MTCCKQVLCITSLRDVSFCCRGRSAAKASYFGYITANMLAGMPVGYVCHVYKTDSGDTAATIVEVGNDPQNAGVA